MKNHKRLLAATLLVTVLLSLVSCRVVSGPEDALEAVDKKMSSLDSYEADMEGLFVYYVRGCRVETTLTGKTIEAETQSEQPYIYQLTETKTKCKELSINESASQMEAYYQGNYFISNEEGDDSQKLYSAATVEQVTAYFERKGGSTDFSLMASCSEKTYQKNDDGTRTLTLKGFDEKTLNKLVGVGEGLAELLNVDRLDLELTMVIDRAFRLSRLTMKLLLIHEDPEKPVEKDKIPELTITFTFGKFNEAAMVTDGLDANDYKQVDDVFQPGRLTATVDDYLDSAQGSFTWKSEQKVQVAGQTTTTEETDDVKFGVRDDGYFYEVYAMTNTSNSTVKVTYANGKQTILNSGKETEKAQTEADAKSFIGNLIKGTLQDSKYATNVVKLEGDSYRIYYKDLPTATYDSLYASAGGQCSRANQTITVIYSDAGKLVSIKSVVETAGTIRSGNSNHQVAVDFTYEITFN